MKFNLEYQKKYIKYRKKYENLKKLLDGGGRNEIINIVEGLNYF